MSDTPAPADQADRLVAQERAQRPRWRDASVRRAPSWFRGEELDLVDAAERRQLYVAARARLGPVPWTSFVALGCLASMDMRHAWRWHWPLALAGAALVVGTAVSMMLRRRLMRRFACESLRESADWPQRLEAQRQP